MDNQSTMPRVGIFWINGEELIAFSVPLDRAENVGGIVNYPHGHVHIWPLVLRSHPQLAGKEYEEVPRGRVSYLADANSFNLLLPSAYLNNRRLTANAIDKFGLRKAHVRIMADEHYDPPRIN